MKFKRKENSLLGIDGALMLLSLVVLCVSLYYFFQDDGLRSGPSPEMSTIGRISSSHNDVRRKIRSGFSWSNVTGKDVVYEGDSIFTGEDSDAAVTLEGGSQLHVDPQSLVVVKTRGTSLQLDLQYGSMVGKVNTGSPLLITQNGKLQEITGKDAEVRIETSGPDQETTIQVVRGEVELQDVEPDVPQQVKQQEVKPKPRKPAQVIKQNQVLDMKPKEKPVIRTVAVQLIAPEGGKSLWLGAGETLPMTWKVMSSDGKGVTCKIQFARDKDFAEPFFSADSATRSYQLPEASRPQGEFFWRVKPEPSTKDANRVELASTANRLTLYADLPPTPVFPADHQEFALLSATATTPAEAGKALGLTWEDQAGSNEFDLQVSRDAEFKTSVVAKRITSLNFRTSLLDAGTYFWRVRGLNPQRKNPPWSRTMQFSIEEEVKAPSAPHLAKTQIDFEIPIAVLKVAPSTVSVKGHGVPASDVPPFAWTTVPNAQGYEVEIAESNTFANSIKQTLSTETNFAPQEVKPGALFVRVRAKGKKGLMSESSEIGRLDVALPAPELAPVPAQVSKYATQADLYRGNHTFNLKWSPRPFAETYELEWGTSADFEQSKKFRLTTSERSIKVTKSMEYAARVRALGPNGIPVSNYSTVQIASFKKELLPPPTPTPVPAPPIVKAKPPVSPGPAPASISTAAVSEAATTGIRGPILQDPKPSSSYVTLEDSLAFVNFKWKPIGGAQSYELQIAQDADFTTVLETLKPGGTSITLKKALPEGKVFWRVRAKLKKGPTEWSDVFNINVLYE